MLIKSAQVWWLSNRSSTFYPPQVLFDACTSILLQLVRTNFVCLLFVNGMHTKESDEFTAIDGWKKLPKNPTIDLDVYCISRHLAGSVVLCSVPCLLSFTAIHIPVEDKVCLTDRIIHIIPCFCYREKTFSRRCFFLIPTHTFCISSDTTSSELIWFLYVSLFHPPFKIKSNNFFSLACLLCIEFDI